MKHIILVLLLCVAMPAYAAEKPTMLSYLSEGQTLLNISATERKTVEQDTIVATLRVEKENRDASELQDTINLMMKDAIDMAKKEEGVDISTQQYYVHEQYTWRLPVRTEADRRKREESKIWKGQQSLTLEGKEADAILKLSGELQKKGFLMNGLNYKLSTEKREEVRENLMEAALEKLQARAKRAGNALGRSNVELVEVNVDAAPMAIIDPMPQMMMARAVPEGASMAAAAPVAEAGKRDIVMTVSARALLKP